MQQPPSTVAATRQARISRARQIVLHDTAPGSTGLVEPWIEQSWRRCLALGLQPRQRVAFDAVSEREMRRTAEGNQLLVQAARPVLSQLGRALADTRYFAILTNHEGVVVDADGPIDRQDRRASVITRVGVDLSEKSVGTTAIGTALRELQPVWLHRGEHFFHDTAVYSCAGTPLFGPDGRCVGMLDLTGVEATERPELQHLAVRSARSIENALLQQRPHRLLLRFNWSGLPPSDDSDGLLALDADGQLVGANHAARQLLPDLRAGAEPHCRDLFALPFEMLFDAARRQAPAIEAPLWSGLRLQVRALRSGPATTPAPAAPWPAPPAASAATARPLREVETELIRQAVEAARGNVAQAARALGISRATVYRKLGSGKRQAA